MNDESDIANARTLMRAGSYRDAEELLSAIVSRMEPSATAGELLIPVCLLADAKKRQRRWNELLDDERPVRFRRARFVTTASRPS
jgi:Tfp pilus assembly protein PilF